MENTENNKDLFPEERPKRRRPRWGAVILLLAVLAAAVAALPALRPRSTGLVYRVGEKGTMITADEDGLPSFEGGLFAGLTLFPPGIWESKTVEAEEGKYFISIYMDENEVNRIDYKEIYLQPITSTIDTEDAEIRTDLRVRGFDALMSVKEGQIILVWTDTERGRLCDLELHGSHPDFTPEMLLEMAESLYEAELPSPEAAETPAPEYVDAEVIFTQHLPRWFPGENWSLVLRETEGASAHLEYEDPHGNRISYTRIPMPETGLSIDAEDAEIRTDLEINGWDALLSEKEEQLILVWTDVDRASLSTLELDGPHPGFQQNRIIVMSEYLSPYIITIPGENG